MVPALAENFLKVRSHFSILIQIPDRDPNFWSGILTLFRILEMEIFLFFVQNSDRVLMHRCVVCYFHVCDEKNRIEKCKQKHIVKITWKNILLLLELTLTRSLFQGCPKVFTFYTVWTIIHFSDKKISDRNQNFGWK